MADELDPQGQEAAASEAALLAANEQQQQAQQTEQQEPGGGGGQQQAVEQQQEEPKPAAHGNKGKTPWYMERINEETNAKRRLQEQLDAEKREKEDLRALLERAQSAPKKDGEEITPIIPPASAPKPVPREQYESDVRAGVAAIKFADDTQAVLSAGTKDFTNFKESLQILAAVGATDDEFIQNLLDVDKANAHKLLDNLAKDPDRTRELVNMNPNQRIAALTRLSVAQQTTKPANVSKAPPPKQGIDPVAGNDGDELRDDLSDATWSRNFDKKHRKTA